MTSGQSSSPASVLVANNRSNRTWHREVTDAVTSTCREDPLRTLVWLRDWLSEGLAVAVELFRRAAAAPQDRSILDVSGRSRLGARLYTALCYAQAIWFDTGVPTYLERAEGPVALGELETPTRTLVGTCHHDVGIAALFGFQTAYRTCSNAGEFAEAIRARFGDSVEHRLSDLSVRVGCESRSCLDRWGTSLTEQVMIVAVEGSAELATHAEEAGEDRDRGYKEGGFGDDAGERTVRSCPIHDDDAKDETEGELVRIKLHRCDEKAWGQYQWALGLHPELEHRTDKDVYDCVKALVETEGESIPGFASWCRYLRRARMAYSTQKNTPRAGRTVGRSIAAPDQI